MKRRREEDILITRIRLNATETIYQREIFISPSRPRCTVSQSAVIAFEISSEGREEKKKKKTRDKRVDEIGKHSEKVGVENRDRVENSNGEKKNKKR